MTKSKTDEKTVKRMRPINITHLKINFLTKEQVYQSEYSYFVSIEEHQKAITLAKETEREETVEMIDKLFIRDLMTTEIDWDMDENIPLKELKKKLKQKHTR